MNIRALFPSSHYAILSLFFFIGLEFWLWIHQWPVILFIIIVTLLIIGIIFIRSEEGDVFHLTQIILPTLAVFGFVAFAIFLPQNIFLHLYFLSTAILFYLILKYGAKQAWPTWNYAISLIVLFTCVSVIIGWRFYLYSPPWIMIALIFPTVSLIAYQLLFRYVEKFQEAMLLSLTIGFILSEIAWILQFLPLQFIVQTGIIVCLYYVIMQIIVAMYEHRLSKRLLLELIISGTIGIVLLGSTARWS